MLRTLLLVPVFAALVGCQGLGRPDDVDSPIVGLRCLILAGKQPFERENLRYIERYADHGSAKCKVALGKMYEEGGYGVDQDLGKARALFAESAALDPSMNVLLGQMAERGEGEPVDYAKARDLYQRSGKSAALPLGRLMAQGKGGPQDIPGALTLYLETTRYVGDDAWKAMDSLRKAGHALNEAQATRFRQVWLKGFLKEQNRRLFVREVLEAVNGSGQDKSVTLTYRFTSDSGTPQVTLTKDSGDANVDAWIMKAAARISLRDSAPLTDETGKLEIVAPLTFKVQEISSRVWGICGRKPCG